MAARPNPLGFLTWFEGLLLPLAVLLLSFGLAALAAGILEGTGAPLDRVAAWFFFVQAATLWAGIELYRRAKAVPPDAVGLRPAAGVSLAATAILVLAIGIGFTLLEALLPLEGMPDTDRVLAPFLEGGLPAWAGFLVGVLILGLIVPVGEELLFRGMILHWLASRLTPVRANLITSAVFAAAHIQVWVLPAGPGLFVLVQLAVLSYVLGRATLKSGSVLPAIAGHAANNVAALALIWAL